MSREKTRGNSKAELKLPSMCYVTLLSEGFVKRLQKATATLPVPEYKPDEDAVPDTMISQIWMLLTGLMRERSAALFVQAQSKEGGKVEVVDSDLVTALTGNIDDGIYSSLMPRDDESAAILSAVIGAMVNGKKGFDCRDFVTSFVEGWLLDLRRATPKSHKRCLLTYIESVANIISNSDLLTRKARMGLAAGSFFSDLSSAKVRQVLALMLAQHVNNLSYHNWVQSRIESQQRFAELSKRVEAQVDLLGRAIMCVERADLDADLVAELQAEGWLSKGVELDAAGLSHVVSGYNASMEADVAALIKAVPFTMALNGHGDLMMRLRSSTERLAGLFKEWDHDPKGHERFAAFAVDVMQQERACQQKLQVLSVADKPVAARLSYGRSFEEAAATDAAKRMRTAVLMAIEVLERGYLSNPSIKDKDVSMAAASALLRQFQSLVKDVEGVLDRTQVELMLVKYYRLRREYMMRLSYTEETDGSFAVVLMALQPTMNALADSLTYVTDERLHSQAERLLAPTEPLSTVRLG